MTPEAIETINAVSGVLSFALLLWLIPQVIKLREDVAELRGRQERDDDEGPPRAPAADPFGLAGRNGAFHHAAAVVR